MDRSPIDPGDAARALRIAIVSPLHESVPPRLYGEREHQGEGPTLYPVACSPQAWAAASAFYLVKACLGLSFRPEEPRMRFLHPVLPAFVDRLRLVNVRVGDAVVDVQFERCGEEVGVNVVRKRGELEVSVVL